MKQGWVGVDLDGTLAFYDGWKGPSHIGKPIPLMLERVKEWLTKGIEVRIFTARAASCNPERLQSIQAIKRWSREHIGQELPITAEKDYAMFELWDDRCVQVIPNEGIAIQDLFKETV